MNPEYVYKGTVRTGIGGGAVEMSKPGALEEFRRFTGLSVIPGTLNIELAESFDLSLLKYVNFADIGWEFDPAAQGIEYDGEIGTYYGRVNISGNYPAFIFFWTWVTNIETNGELISPYHLRSSLSLQDGDIIEFTLTE